MNNHKNKSTENKEAGSKSALQNLNLGALNPWYLIVGGIVSLAILVVLLYAGGTSQKANDAVLARAQQAMTQVSAVLQNIRRVLQDQQVQELATIAATDSSKLANLQQYVSGRIPELIELKLFGPELKTLRADDADAYGYAVLDLLLDSAGSNMAPAQIHGSGESAYLALAMRVGEQTAPTAFLFALIKPDVLTSVFNASLSDPGAFALDQYNGRFTPNKIIDFGSPVTPSQRLAWLRIPGSLFRVGVVQGVAASSSMGVLRPLFFVLGLILLSLGLLLKFRPNKAPVELTEDDEDDAPPAGSHGLLAGAPASTTEPAVALGPVEPGTAAEATVDQKKQKRPRKKTGLDLGDGLGAIELPDLGLNLEKMQMPRQKTFPPVELLASIFRAYDIRGIVGKTLDAEVARQVGQVVGSLTLEQDAGPVIVARDGRSSGPDLVAGMIKGIASTGCDVIDIGAVPTGVLYFAAYEIGKGTGVMVTGSHNPPEYNGIKMVIGGVTLAGENITGMYDRIKSGDLLVGEGKVSRQDVLSRYREAISSDIQLKKPLKVVADCGNGIGGVCAADVLRDIGADVITLFDEVDGTFPNHHPDPSEPENLVDLIGAVKLMGADIGVAFDGDADRLGVVTSSGEIIYSDRLMMLFVKDILSRVPGSTIIYDVKCTGHLHDVIEQAGGKAMMYKTGHSLIKNKMKEVDAPFAGEMSGHFFFKERWYGFDCGIYSAARLLEILAADERSVEEILSSLPNSISTPELKVHTKEGENHSFVAELQEKGVFPGATINTIDGVRADFPDGWGLVRASNTTPILVVRFDADSEEALQRIKDLFREQILAINDSFELPF